MPKKIYEATSAFCQKIAEMHAEEYQDYPENIRGAKVNFFIEYFFTNKDGKREQGFFRFNALSKEFQEWIAEEKKKWYNQFEPLV